MEIPMKKTQCSFCGSEYVTEVQYDENFEKFTAASKAAWVGLSDDEDDVCACKADAAHGRDDTQAWAAVYRSAIEAKLKEKNT